VIAIGILNAYFSGLEMLWHSKRGKHRSCVMQAMEQDGGNYNPGLNNAVVSTGECYEEIGRLYEEQPR
jgi:hypothetical protein